MSSNYQNVVELRAELRQVRTPGLRERISAALNGSTTEATRKVARVALEELYSRLAPKAQHGDVACEKAVFSLLPHTRDGGKAGEPVNVTVIQEAENFIGIQVFGYGTRDTDPNNGSVVGLEMYPTLRVHLWNDMLSSDATVVEMAAAQEGHREQLLASDPAVDYVIVRRRHHYQLQSISATGIRQAIANAATEPALRMIYSTVTGKVYSKAIEVEKDTNEVKNGK